MKMEPPNPDREGNPDMSSAKYKEGKRVDKLLTDQICSTDSVGSEDRQPEVASQHDHIVDQDTIVVGDSNPLPTAPPQVIETRSDTNSSRKRKASMEETSNGTTSVKVGSMDAAASHHSKKPRQDNLLDEEDGVAADPDPQPSLGQSPLVSYGSLSRLGPLDRRESAGTIARDSSQPPVTASGMMDNALAPSAEASSQVMGQDTNVTQVAVGDDADNTAGQQKSTTPQPQTQPSVNQSDPQSVQTNASNNLPHPALSTGHLQFLARAAYSQQLQQQQQTASQPGLPVYPGSNRPFSSYAPRQPRNSFQPPPGYQQPQPMLQVYPQAQPQQTQPPPLNPSSWNVGPPPLVPPPNNVQPYFEGRVVFPIYPAPNHSNSYNPTPWAVFEHPSLVAIGVIAYDFATNERTAIPINDANVRAQVATAMRAANSNRASMGLGIGMGMGTGSGQAQQQQYDAQVQAQGMAQAVSQIQAQVGGNGGPSGQQNQLQSQTPSMPTPTPNPLTQNGTPPTASRPGLTPDQIAASNATTKAIIDKLASNATSDDTLREILRAVATAQATPKQLARFHGYVEWLHQQHRQHLQQQAQLEAQQQAQLLAGGPAATQALLQARAHFDSIGAGGGVGGQQGQVRTRFGRPAGSKARKG